MEENIIMIREAVPLRPEYRFDRPVNWSIKQDQHWAIIGPNGSGKTLLTNMLMGKLVLKTGIIDYAFNDDRLGVEQIEAASFQDVHAIADYQNFYYQQRWNASEIADSPWVRDLLKDVASESQLQDLFSLFGLSELLDKQLILLSNGELRKFSIIRKLLKKPRILILDNPYIGLDSSTRVLLNDLLNQIIRREALNIVMVLSNPAEIPDFTTHVLPVFHHKRLGESLTISTFRRHPTLLNELFPCDASMPVLPVRQLQSTDYNIALELQNVHINYGKRVILDRINWSVKKGEKWALLGPNGSGKSTLLSLIYADNPQSYANSLYLFDKKRGSGESIWEIKKRIGYVSPEIHLYCRRNPTSIHLVASGFFDSDAIYTKCNTEQLQTARHWMDIFGITELQDRPFLQLSLGEQRLVMLARAFVKNPELLILDEPLHGLDVSNKINVLNIIEAFCNQQDKTMIYVTHYQDEIPSCVDKYFVME